MHITIIHFAQNIYGSFYYIVSLFCENIPSDYDTARFNLITHAHYLASNIIFLLSVWSETHILNQFACITVGIMSVVLKNLEQFPSLLAKF